MPELTVESVSTAYGRISALRDVSLAVPDGGAVGILGANGAGKSTLMKTVAGLLVPTAGEITFDRQPITGAPAESVVADGIALVPEGRRVFADMTVEDNLLLGGYSVSRSVSKLKARMGDIFDLFPRLAERRHQPAGTLSGGEQQMLAIGRGLMSAPRLLLLDEPSLGLAPVVVAEVMDRLANLRRETGLTVVLVEQNLHVARRVVDSCTVLANGSVVLDGTVDELIDDERLQAAYLGRSVDKQEA